MLLKIAFAIIISANAEWSVIKQLYPNEYYEKSPYGEYFYKEMVYKDGKKETVLFFHGGWGKVSAAGSAQYVIDTFSPQYLINLGTCGGFAGKINRFDVILVDKAIIYDIIEAMGDSKEAIDDYTTSIDLSWLGTQYPSKVIKTTLVSADRDLIVKEMPELIKKYKAIAGDWETGAIAYVAARNQTKLVILRGVSDLVSEKGGEAYGNTQVFVKGTEVAMKKLLADLPLWIDLILKK
jgi:adenosylhomocysteine nucleosidase